VEKKERLDELELTEIGSSSGDLGGDLGRGEHHRGAASEIAYPEMKPGFSAWAAMPPAASIRSATSSGLGKATRRRLKAALPSCLTIGCDPP